MARLLLLILAVAGLAVSSAANWAVAQEGIATETKPLAVEQDRPESKPTNRFDQAIIEAFKKTHDGWSSDEVILQDKLNKAFLKACRSAIGDDEEATPATLNWRLLTLRKAGKLKVKATKRSPASKRDVTDLAEIGIRSVQDKHSISSDRIMTDPKLRAAFDATVSSLDPKVDLYLVRKAAFQLRKTRKLQPELISRFADWGRVVKSYTIQELREQVDSIDRHPGIYIFRDKTGYMYIGQTENLRKRMAEHLDESHNPALAKYIKEENEASVELHSFDPKSRAKEVRVRRAYESELIRSRKPRFNVLP
jgi:predicted GIY-YIG superfamily endonuclease